MDENIATKILKKSPIFEVVGRSEKIGVLLLYLPYYTLERMERAVSDCGEIPGKGVMGYFAMLIQSGPYTG